jgi:hypothetical protein
MSNNRSDYLAYSFVVAGLATFLFNQKYLLAQSLPPGTDLGYNHLPKAFVDANGDGLVDYCRFVGDEPKVFIACMLGTQSGFDINNQITAFTSARGINQGYPDRPRGFRDVNGDGKADYCRFDGPPGKIQEYCNPAFDKGFSDDSQRILTGNTDPNSTPAISSNQNFPLRGSQFTELGDHRRMETSITISSNGRIDGVTRIWTAKQWSGFTGAVAVAVTDSAGNILYVTEPHSYGVDCKRCPGPSDRTQQWADTVPSNILNQVKGYAIVHSTNPRNRWREWLRDAREAAQSIQQIRKEFN